MIRRWFKVIDCVLIYDTECLEDFFCILLVNGVRTTPDVKDVCINPVNK